MRGKPKLIKLTDKSGNLKSDCWYIHYYDGKRSQRVSTGCQIGSQDHEANLFLSAFTLEREKPTAREPDKLMVAQALNDYYEEHAQFIATAKHAQYHESRLNAYFRGQFVSQVTQAGINKYVRERQDIGESNGTIRRDLEHLQAAFNHEVREQRLLYAPKFKKPSPPAPKERFLTEEEAAKLLTNCKAAHLKAFVQIMLATGQRPGAIERLQWFQVDFNANIIRFDKANKHKNKQARAIPMNDELRALLQKLHADKTTEYVLEFVQINQKKGTRTTRPAGNVKKAFQRACVAAGLDGVSRYTLRHTWGTQKYIEGFHEKDISDIMGHTTAKTTSKHYLHTQMGRLREIVKGKKDV